MAMQFQVFTDHLVLQWLKSMRTSSVLLHWWSVVLEDCKFTVKHRPGKSQAYIDSLGHLAKVLPLLLDKAALHLSPLPDKEAAWNIARIPHATTYLGGETLWKLFKITMNTNLGSESTLKSPTRAICAKLALTMASGKRPRALSPPSCRGILY